MYRRKKHTRTRVIFPPLPPTPPPPRVLSQIATPPSSPTRPDNCVHDFIRSCKTNELLPYASAEKLGLDGFLYMRRGLVKPCDEQFEALRSKLIYLAIQDPDTLCVKAESFQLDALLGADFSWVECARQSW